MLAHPGQLAELGFITLEFGINGRPTVSWLGNEIDVIDPHDFQQFRSAVQDPPLLYGTTTAPTSYRPNRYYFQQGMGTDVNPVNPAPLLVRHLQIKVDYPAEDAFNELYTLCINGALHAEI